MRTPSGAEIPDPPEDPRERAKWKIKHRIFLATLLSERAARQEMLRELIAEAQAKVDAFDFSWDTQEVVDWLKQKLEALDG